MSHLLTVFGVCEDNQGDVDVAILQALLKGGEFMMSIQVHKTAIHCIAALTFTWLEKLLSTSKKSCGNDVDFHLNVFCPPLVFLRKD